MGRLKRCLFKVLTVRQGENRKRCWTVLRVQHLFSCQQRKKNLIRKKTGILDLWRGEKEG